MIRNLLFLIAATIVAPAFVGPASAQNLPPRAMPAQDAACVRECREGYKVCLSAIREDVRLCRAECPELLAAARATCATAPRSQECADARETANACLRPCRSQTGEAVTACRSQLGECSSQCPERGEIGRPDRTCTSACREGLQSCRARANAATRDCISDCAELRRSAADICRADRGSEACRAALAEAHACVKPCHDRLANWLRQCVSNAGTCGASCEESRPTRPVSR